MLSLKLLGRVSLTRDGRTVVGQAAQRRRLAFLALLAAGPAEGVPREKLVWYLWPDTDPEQARRFLADSLYALRKALGADAIPAVGDALRLDPRVLGSDVAEFREAAARGDWQSAVTLYAGPFLDGFVVRAAPEFERWMEETRAELARVHARALERLARGAEARGAYGEAAEWWRRLQTTDPFSGPTALALIAALDAAGDRAAALRHARAHEALLRAELDIGPDAAVLAAVERLRASTDRPAAVERSSVGPPGAASGPEEQPPHIGAGATAPDRLPVRPTPDPPGRAGSREAAGRRRVALSVAVVVLLAALGWATAPRRPPPDQHERVLVAPFENRTGDAALDPIGSLAADWIARGLLETGTLEVISPTWASYGPGDTTLHAIRALAARGAASIVVSGAYHRIGDSLRLEAQVHDAERGTLLQSLEPIGFSRESLTVAVEQLRQRLASSLAARRVAARELREVTTRTQPPKYAAYLEYLEGVQLFSTYRTREAAARFERAWVLDTSFDLARLYSVLLALNTGQHERADSLIRSLAGRRERLGAFDRALLDAFEAARRGDRMGGLRAMRVVSRMTPGSQFTVGHAVTAVQANRPREALAALSRLDPTTGLLRENSRFWDWLTVCRHLLGEHERELEDARRARRAHPELQAALAMEIRAQAALGRVQQVERLLDESASLAPSPDETPADIFRLAAAELRAHGHEGAAMRAWDRAIAWYRARPEPERSRHQRALAAVLYGGGRWDEAYEALERYRAANPEDLWALGQLGTLAARRGDHAGARRSDEWLAASSATGARGAAELWRARIAAQLGEEGRAVQLFREALSKGAVLGMWVHVDQDLTPLRRDPDFAALVRPVE